MSLQPYSPQRSSGRRKKRSAGLAGQYRTYSWSDYMVPVMRAIGKAPHVSVFKQTDLCELVVSAGFELVASEDHATKGGMRRPYVAARKPCRLPS